MKTILVDDEALALRHMETLLREMEEVKLIGKYKNSKEVTDVLLTDQPDLIFLAVEMDEMNGMEIAKQIQNKYPSIHIVFVSTSKHHAVEAFDLNALDYLRQPVSKKRLLQTVQRAKEKQVW